jgi:hypothetical protein
MIQGLNINGVMKETQAAEILCVAVQTLRNWRHQRKGPPYLVVGKRGIRYEIDDLKNYIDRKKIYPEGQVST